MGVKEKDGEGRKEREMEIISGCVERGKEEFREREMYGKCKDLTKL